MSCQSLATRAFTDTDKDTMTHCTTFHRSVRFSSESRSSMRTANEHKRDASGCMSMSTITPTSLSTTPPAMSQSAPPPSATFDLDETPAPPPSSCRFPKLEECAHFHYERVCLGGISVELVPCENQCPETVDEGWICLKVRSHVNESPDECEVRVLNASWSEASEVSEWTLSRNRENLLRLDDMLHKCIYDRKVSGLPNLSEELNPSLNDEAYNRLIADYMHHLSIIADDSINCGPVLNWLQMDNRGHKLLVSNEDSSSINTPAVAAAYSVRKYVSQARDEISFEVGDMISIIDMPGPQESVWWRGKRGFRVGFFPRHCVAVIGDKVPRHMTQPPPIVGSVAVAPIKPVLRKHGKLISLFRSFILSRPSRRSLKQQGILRERVFGCDLGEHILNSGYDVPPVLVECARCIESRGAVDGVYRLSGGAGLTQRLRAAIDAGRPLPDAPDLQRDPHAVPSLLKMYFRELPNPLCTYQLYESFVSAMQEPDEMSKLRAVRQTVVKLPPPHYRTLAYLMRHLRRVSLLGAQTGMTPRNMAIVWAPNLLRAPRPHHALQGVAVQAVVTEFLICYAEELFAQEQGADDSGPESIEQESESQVELRGTEGSGRRPKSLPVNPPTKLLSLEEARRRGGVSICTSVPPAALPASGAIAAAAATQLRPSATHKPKYIEVGSGPDNLPQYHTVLELPLNGGKRGVKRSPSGWRGLFARNKHRATTHTHKHESKHADTQERVVQDVCTERVSPCLSVRPVKSCESLTSETDTVAPLNSRPHTARAQHTRSSSCDSYFEPWVAELNDMRLRLAPQERDHHMFSEEDDTVLQLADSLCSSPPESGLCSVEPSPRKNLKVDIEAANEAAAETSSGLVLDLPLPCLKYIDGESPRAVPEKRHNHRPPSPHNADIAKRLCKDRTSLPLVTDFPVNTGSVKLRERNSPRKTKSTRYSNITGDLDKVINTRLSWPKEGHSTLIKIDWPLENSITNLTTSSPLTPITPIYDQLETDSESDNKHTIKISHDCLNCNEGTCLKCELKATDYETIGSNDLSPLTDISYQNLRLSAISSSSEDRKKVMTSSHESSSFNDDYETYNFNRPSYINLNSSSDKSSGNSPLKSPLKSTISITFRSPSKTDVYEAIDIVNNLSIVEDASVPDRDATLPTQDAFQPEYNDLIILDTPNEDVYDKVKFFKKSIDEVNAIVFDEKSIEIGDGFVNVDDGDDKCVETDDKSDVVVLDDKNSIEIDTANKVLEDRQEISDIDIKQTQNFERHYENILFSNDYENVNLSDKLEIGELKTDTKDKINVKELAIKFESPTELKSPFKFETNAQTEQKVILEVKSDHKLNKQSTRSLDENAFIKEFGSDKPLNENKQLDSNISLKDRKIRDVKQLIDFDVEKKLSRERIEKYKQERRMFLREKYSSQSFRSNPEELTRIKIKKDRDEFERRNTVDLGQRMRFSLAKSDNNLDLQSPGDSDRNERKSSTYNIKDMTALFETKPQTNGT